MEFDPIKFFLKKYLPECALKQIETGDLVDHLRNESVDVLIPAMTKIDEYIISQSPTLKLIQQWGEGLEGVDIDAATRFNIAVANVPTARTGNAESVAEWCVMAALALSRQYPAIEKNVYNGHPWGSPCGQALFGRTAGIVGFGGIGKQLASRLRPFGMHLIAVKRNWRDFPAEEYGLDWVGGVDSLPRLLIESDYIFLCMPAKPETKHIIGRKELARMTRGSFLINPSRGSLINRDALTEALEEDRLSGVALDVYWREPTIPRDKLFSHPKVLCTPHIAGVTDVSFMGIGSRVTENIKRVMNGLLPLHCANPAVVMRGAPVE